MYLKIVTLPLQSSQTLFVKKISVEAFKWLRERESECLHPYSSVLQAAGLKCSWWRTLLIRSTSTRLMLPKPIRQQGSEAHFPAPFPFHHIHPDFSIIGYIQTLNATPPAFLFFFPNQYNLQSKIWVITGVNQRKYMGSFSINPNITEKKCIVLTGINTTKCS